MVWLYTTTSCDRNIFRQFYLDLVGTYQSSLIESYSKLFFKYNYLFDYKLFNVYQYLARLSIHSNE